MPSNSIYILHAEVCKALGNPLRIQIINVLKDKEPGFSDILVETGGLKSTLSQHLTVMVGKGILLTQERLCRKQNLFLGYSLINENYGTSH
jgi:ArsR family transcriptional regulator